MLGYPRNMTPYLLSPRFPKAQIQLSLAEHMHGPQAATLRPLPDPGADVAEYCSLVSLGQILGS